MDWCKLTVYITKNKRKELKSYCIQKDISMTQFVDEAIQQRIRRELEEARKSKS